jgi:HAMP domain-containing protein
MGIRSKIMYGFLTLAAMLFLAGIISIIEFRNMGQSLEKLLDENYKSIASGQLMLESVNKCNKGILLILTGQNNHGRLIINMADSVFMANLKLAKEFGKLPGEDTILNSIDSTYSSYRTLWTRPLALIKAESKLDWFFQTAYVTNNVLTLKIMALREMNSHSIYKTISSVKKKAKQAVMPGIVAIIAAFVFSLIFNYFINYYFVNPIIKISNGVNDFSAYGTPFKVNIETNDEILELKNSVENMVNKSGTEKS